MRTTTSLILVTALLLMPFLMGAGKLQPPADHEAWPTGFWTLSSTCAQIQFPNQPCGDEVGNLYVIWTTGKPPTTDGVVTSYHASRSYKTDRKQARQIKWRDGVAAHWRPCPKKWDPNDGLPD